MYAKKLKAEQVTGVTSRVKWFIENFMYCRWQFIKNDPRGQWLVLRGLAIPIFNYPWLYLVWYFLTSLVQWAAGHSLTDSSNCQDIISIFREMGQLSFGDVSFGSYVFSVSAIFWNISNVFKRNWQYCAGLYNEILLKDFSGDESRRFQYRLLKTSLAIDLLVHDLWAQRAFSRFFTECLEEAEEHYFLRGDPLGRCEDETTALRTLERYHCFCWKKIKEGNSGSL